MKEKATEPARVGIFGVPFVVADLEQASMHFVDKARSTQVPLLSAHADVHVLTRALHDGSYGQGIAKFDYVCPDGMPLHQCFLLFHSVRLFFAPLLSTLFTTFF